MTIGRIDGAARSTMKVGVGGTEIALEEAGEGYPLLALHGFSPDHRLMSGCLEPLFDAEGRASLPASGYAFSFDGLGKTGLGEAFEPRFPRPTLFLLGRADSSTGYRDALRLADRYPKGSYAILDGVGHNLQIEASGLFANLVADWLARCELEGKRPRSR